MPAKRARELSRKPQEKFRMPRLALNFEADELKYAMNARTFIGSGDWKPTFNAIPGVTKCPIVTSTEDPHSSKRSATKPMGRVIETAHWGVEYSGEGSTSSKPLERYLCRAESLYNDNGKIPGLHYRRCIIPVRGVYLKGRDERSTARGREERIWFACADEDVNGEALPHSDFEHGRIMPVAGIRVLTQNSRNWCSVTFMMITRPIIQDKRWACNVNRQPLILNDGIDCERWLDERVGVDKVLDRRSPDCHQKIRFKEPLRVGLWLMNGCSDRKCLWTMRSWRQMVEKRLKAIEMERLSKTDDEERKRDSSPDSSPLMKKYTPKKRNLSEMEAETAMLRDPAVLAAFTADDMLTDEEDDGTTKEVMVSPIIGTR